MQLTVEQAQLVHDRLWPALSYLTKLEHRMHELHCPENDPLYARVVKAQEAIQDLVMELRGWGGKGEVTATRTRAKKQ
jgi:hypothetical protein